MSREPRRCEDKFKCRRLAKVRLVNPTGRWVDMCRVHAKTLILYGEGFWKLVGPLEREQ